MAWEDLSVSGILKMKNGNAITFDKQIFEKQDNP